MGIGGSRGRAGGALSADVGKNIASRVSCDDTTSGSSVNTGFWENTVI